MSLNYTFLILQLMLDIYQWTYTHFYIHFDNKLPTGKVFEKLDSTREKMKHVHYMQGTILTMLLLDIKTICTRTNKR